MRRFLVFLLGLAILLAGAAAWAVWNVRATLPRADEVARVDAAGLLPPGTAVAIDYDSRGVPTIHAQDELSLAFGQGWAHARDRRFQMELYRRGALGRLSELVGSSLLNADRLYRVYGFAGIADSALLHLDPARRRRFDAYAAGVNAWDKGHRKAPEFLALGVTPEPWRARDVILVTMLMLQDLTWDQADEEKTTEIMDASLPPSVVAFLRPGATAWDAPLDEAAAPPPAPTPGPADFDARIATSKRADAGVLVDRLALGSNNWAIAGSRTASGRALVAGDPHLALRVPVIWHRQKLDSPDLKATGITLPGVPGIVFGTNGRVAWTGTNVEADFVDLVRCVPVDGDTTSYQGPAGPEPFGARREVILVRGVRADTIVVRTTRFGPVIARSAKGGWLAAQWTALTPAMYDTDLFGMDRAGSVAEFLQALAGYGGPPLNFVVGDTSGTIAWAVGGRLPRRAGDPARPREASDPLAAWTGFVPADSLPRVIAPARGFVMTANQRTVGGAGWQALAGMPAAPWRARRIAQVLSAKDGWTAAECARLQNDVDDAFLLPTAEALDRALTPESVRADTTLAQARRILSGWTHRADTTSVAHAYLRYVRGELTRLLVEPLIAPCLARDSTFVYDWTLSDEVVRRMLTERPAHLLDARYADYDALVRDAARAGAALMRKRVPGVPLERIAWGRINRADVAHPLALGLPQLGSLLNMPAAALSGGANVVRVTRPRSGASMRMVVDLADPARSTWALPGGQSGHFLSTAYGDEFAGWVKGETVPLEPGPALHHVRLTVR